MLGKACIVFAFWAGATALNLQDYVPDRWNQKGLNKAKNPVEFGKDNSENPVEFSTKYRMNLVRQFQAYTFEDFMEENEKSYTKGTPEYKKRAAIFHRRKAETIRLAGLKKLTWTPAMNKFLDQTAPEIVARLGYRPEKGRKSKGSSFARKPMEAIPGSWTSAINLDWRPNMTNSMNFDKDQGACGSCWAVATASAVEAHADVHFGVSVPLSMQQLVSCTPNPKHCGGRGGCEGATAELALDYAQSAGGIVMEENYPYSSMFGDSGNCDAVKSKDPTVLIGGYKGVPQNNLAATMYALSQGPLIVAVDASPWSFYGSGIFNSCKQDVTLNHAVVLVGYGLQGTKGYWMIRNSWGSDWGMNGYIRLSRQTTATTATFCGMDYKPQEGSACDGETDPVKVCGMCGILYEPVLPIVNAVNKPSNFESIMAGVMDKKMATTRKKLNRKIQQ